jgi:hypothetical protein
MGLLKKSFFLALVLTSMALIPSARSEDVTYHPEALQAVKNLAVATKSANETPVVIFDLDDTLINTRERTVRILKDLISRDTVKWKFPRQVLALQSLKPEDIHFSLADTMKAKGIINGRFLKVAQDAWDKNFFTNRFCAHDVANPGGVRYVQELAQLGVKIVYLTGRDTGRMGKGTVYNLLKLGLPLDGIQVGEHSVKNLQNLDLPFDGPQARLIMKQDIKVVDLTFKISMFDSIKKLGPVVGVFENEPANINAHHEAFKEAVAIFLDTIHSDSDTPVEDGIFWVKDFRLPADVWRSS